MSEEAPPQTEETTEDPAAPPPPELNPGEEIVECPKCHCPRRQFTIVEGQCDSCRNKAQQTAGIITVIGWPEVRHRRNLIMTRTDWAVLPDQPQARIDRFAPVRVELRDVTEKTDPLEAWYELDRLESQVAQITVE